jgi:hypothetical protein
MKILGYKYSLHLTRASIADFGGICEGFFIAVTLVPHLVPPPI